MKTGICMVVLFTLKKKVKMITEVKYRMKKITHKYGLEVPRNVTHVYELYKRNNNTLGAEKIKKEMTNSRGAF